VAPGVAAGRVRARASVPWERSVLPNGLRVVTQPMPTARSVAVGLFVGVGSRREDEAHAGLSHLLEHLVFKGTRRYPEAGGLSEAIEGCGGSVNAATDRELTIYTARVPAEAASRALEVVADLVLSPLLRGPDLVSEKPVIVDEIRMYIDSPGDHVFSLFDELLFGGHPLGREIAGTPRSVRRARHDAVLRHWERWYRPPNLVLAAAGAIKHDQVLKAAAGWFEADGSGPAPTHLPAPLEAPTPAPPGAVRVAFRRLSQGNLCIGMPGVARDHPDRWALDLLGAVLGDGMSSRLFQSVREELGLAYDISSGLVDYADAGALEISAGVDPDALDDALKAIIVELVRLRDEPIPADELERAKRYLSGGLELRMDETRHVASWIGGQEALHDRVLTVDEALVEVAAVKADDIQRLAATLVVDDGLRLAAVAPGRALRGLDRHLRLPA